MAHGQLVGVHHVESLLARQRRDQFVHFLFGIARYQQRRPIDDIAKMLSKTVSAVSVQLFAIRQKLRECVEKKWRAHAAANS